MAEEQQGLCRQQRPGNICLVFLRAPPFRRCRAVVTRQHVLYL